MRQALETGQGYGGTVEFFPEEGKYHMDGHRACQVRLEPEETRQNEGHCPTCGKPVTVGVMHRVETLADRTVPEPPASAAPFRSLVPLPEILAELTGVGPKSKRVAAQIDSLTSRLGPELEILEHLPLESFRRDGDPLLGEAIERLRQGQVHREGGYDGEYGTIRLFEPGELESRTMLPNLFDQPLAPTAEKRPNEVPGTPKEGTPEEVPGTPSEVPGTPSEAPIEGPGTPNILSTVLQTGEMPALPSILPETTASPSILDRLDADQRVAAEILEGPLLIIAGPGTGKTRTLTHRIAHLITSDVAAPEECLAITFTRRAAEELRERLTELLGAEADSIPVHTFHGLGLTMLRAEGGEIGLHRGFRIAEENERIDLACDLFDLSTAKASRLLAEFARIRRQRAASEVVPRTAPENGADTALDQESALDEESAQDGIEDPVPIPERLAVYEAALWERDLVDFDDLLVLPIRLLSKRPDLRAIYRERFPWISIDEYQDIDPLQYRLVRLLAPKHANLCAIGDPDQSIYRFRGAEVGFFLRFQEDFALAQQVHLGRNYRSSRTIVDAALSAIGPSSLVTQRQLRAVDEAKSEPVVVSEAASEAAESERVVHTIEQLLGGTSYFSVDSGRVQGGLGSDLSFNDFALLYRTDAQAGSLIEALERSGIPYQKRSHTRLADRPEVRVLLASLRRGELAQANSPARRSPTSVLDRLADEAVQLATLTEAANASAKSSSGTLGAGAFRRAVDLVAPLAKRHGDDLQGFLAEISLGAEIDTWDPRAERVSLLTLHAAKGLEFPVVFIVGCEEGLLPLRFSAETTDEEVEEERRLFFVGMTRARQRLYLSWAKRRSWRGEVRDRKPSGFLDDIDEALLERRKGDEDWRKKKPEGPKQLRLL
ncbi:MAG: UvrD-helicase domain-containing protein, partial [Acidobacteriota bacterium]